MSIFLKLVLAHFIADFVLQFDELYKLKVKSRLGHLGHVVFHWLAMLIVLLPCMTPFFFFFTLALAVIHFYQDMLKYGLQKKYPAQTFWFFTVDQILHFAFLATVLLFPQGRVRPELSGPEWFLTAYSDTTAIYVSLFIAATFLSSYFLHSFRRSFLASTSRPNHFISSPEMFHALVERPLLLGLFLFHPTLSWLTGIVIIVAGLRLAVPQLRNLPDFLMSAGFTALLAFVFKHWV